MEKNQKSKGLEEYGCPGGLNLDIGTALNGELGPRLQGAAMWAQTGYAEGSEEANARFAGTKAFQYVCALHESSQILEAGNQKKK